MTMMRTDAFVLSLLALSSSVNAFTVGKAARTTKPFLSRSVRPMAEEDKGFFMSEPTEEVEKEKTTFVSSVFKKEIAYDEKSGRFFETGFGEGDCVPEDEFCIVDKETGTTVRLTIEEKERIFLDSLQVSLPSERMRKFSTSLFYATIYSLILFLSVCLSSPTTLRDASSWATMSLTCSKKTWSGTVLQ
jgi:hypothetical protein